MAREPARAPVQQKVEPGPKPTKKKAKRRPPERARAASVERTRPKLSTSSPIVLVLLFAVVAGAVIYFATR